MRSLKYRDYTVKMDKKLKYTKKETMEYIWTRGFVKDLALANKKVDNDVLYSV